MIERYGVPSTYDSLQQNSCRHPPQKEAADGVAGQEQPANFFQLLCHIVKMDASFWSVSQFMSFKFTQVGKPGMAAMHVTFFWGEGRQGIP